MVDGHPLGRFSARRFLEAPPADQPREVRQLRERGAAADARRGGYSGIPFPYKEGLRIDEAMHPLTLLATGLYGEAMPNQDGAPIRLVVPWKYGFKNGKSLVRIKLQETQPLTTWGQYGGGVEYGFYANVNPDVDHPRWSQAKERRIGELTRRRTLMFNGYDEVAKLYAGMDLQKFF